MSNKLVKILFLSIILSIAGILTSCEQDEIQVVAVDPNACNTTDVSFKSFIQPLFTANCVVGGCHGAGFALGDLTSYAGVIGVKSKIDDKINGSMNQYLKQDSTLGCNMLKIKAWLDQGAKDN